MDVVLGLIVVVFGFTAFYFAVLLLLLAIVNYSGFLIQNRDDQNAFFKSLKYFFYHNQNENISVMKIFKISVWLTLITNVVIIGFEVIDTL